jgi:hypothetical protein
MIHLIKLSKNQKPKRDSFILLLGSSGGETSQISQLFHLTRVVVIVQNSTLHSPMQAWEAHLAVEEKGLDDLRVSAVRRGLDVCHECHNLKA